MEAHKMNSKSNQAHELRIVRVETVIEHISYLLDRLDKRFDTVEDKIEKSIIKSDNNSVALGDRISQVDNKFDRTSKWLVGIGVTSLISVFGAIINIALKLNG